MLKDFLYRMSSEEGNAIRYRIIYSFCFVVHSFYAILFTLTGVTELMIFNIISSVLYFAGMVFVRNNRFTLIWVVLVILEIISHGLFCSMYLGYDYQFSLFSFSIIPVTYFITYLDPAISHPIIFSSVLSLITGFSIAESMNVDFIREPVYRFPRQFTESVAMLNMVFCILILISFSIMFIGKINYDLKTLKEQNDTLDRLANYDQLTGLRNRNHIREIFEQYIKSTEPYCVILGDIDDFKQVNDTYGHSAGDEVLRTVSDIISGNVGDSGEVCRWGGEEILILLKGTNDACTALTERILSQIRGTVVESGDSRIKITMTFGLCDYGDAMNIEKLISIADERLYIGKNSGKNKVITEN
ncbi:MAG: diguanylate cyclase [Ruminiclostridium sp.]|nr:diguanylate cyclase [Ruminiclostridium sp.]